MLGQLTGGTDSFVAALQESTGHARHGHSARRKIFRCPSPAEQACALGSCIARCLPHKASRAGLCQCTQETPIGRTYRRGLPASWAPVWRAIRRPCVQQPDSKAQHRTAAWFRCLLSSTSRTRHARHYTRRTHSREHTPEDGLVEGLGRAGTVLVPEVEQPAPAATWQHSAKSHDTRPAPPKQVPSTWGCKRS